MQLPLLASHGLFRTGRDRNAGRTAFTLTELLVCVAVIVILVALISPALTSASHASRASKCVSNLRQLGLGIINYQNDHEEFPTGGWTGGIPWVDQIFPYVGKNKDVFYCPESGKTGPGGLAGWNNFPAPYQNIVYSMSYAYNATINTDGQTGIGEGPKNAASAHSLAKLPMVVDIVWENNFYNFDGVFPQAPTPTVFTSFACRHSGMGNVLWGDGSVSAWPTSSLYALTKKYGTLAFCTGNY